MPTTYDWSYLDDIALTNMAKFLPIRDQAICLSVCQSWNRNTKIAMRSRRKLWFQQSTKTRDAFYPESCRRDDHVVTEYDLVRFSSRHGYPTVEEIQSLMRICWNVQVIHFEIDVNWIKFNFVQEILTSQSNSVECINFHGSDQSLFGHFGTIDMKNHSIYRKIQSLLDVSFPRLGHIREWILPFHLGDIFDDPTFVLTNLSSISCSSLSIRPANEFFVPIDRRSQLRSLGIVTKANLTKCGDDVIFPNVELLQFNGLESDRWITRGERFDQLIVRMFPSLRHLEIFNLDISILCVVDSIERLLPRLESLLMTIEKRVTSNIVNRLVNRLPRTLSIVLELKDHFSNQLDVVRTLIPLESGHQIRDVSVLSLPDNFGRRPTFQQIVTFVRDYFTVRRFDLFTFSFVQKQYTMTLGKSQVDTLRSLGVKVEVFLGMEKKNLDDVDREHHDLTESQKDILKSVGVRNFERTIDVTKFVFRQIS